MSRHSFPRMRSTLVLVSLVLVLAFAVLSATSCGTQTFSDAVHQKLVKTVQQIMSEENIAGTALGLWHNGKVLVTGFGMVNQSMNRSPLPSDLCRDGSITKTYTANVILQLVDDKKLSLNTKLSKFSFSKGLPNTEEVTMTELLNHTSGYGDPANGNPEFQKVMFANLHKEWTNQEMLAWGKKTPTVGPPGGQYHYSNFGYYLLGMIIEQVEGKPIAQVFKDRCFTPLKLNHTGFDDTDGYLTSSQHMTGYLPKGTDSNGQPQLTDITTWNTSWAWSAGSMVSDLTDMKTWIESDAKGTLISPAMKAQQQQDNLAVMPDGTSKYGLGIVETKLTNGQTLYWHNGAVPGYSTFAGCSPASGLTIVVFQNTQPGSNGDSTPATNTAFALLQVLGLVQPTGK